MSSPVLSVADPARREAIRAALEAAGLDWQVLAPAELTDEHADVLADTPRVRSDLRKRLRHDVRTPLAILLGQADLLELEPLTPRQQRCVETLRTHCERLERMLSEIASEVVP